MVPGGTVFKCIHIIERLFFCRISCRDPAVEMKVAARKRWNASDLRVHGDVYIDETVMVCNSVWLQRGAAASGGQKDGRDHRDRDRDYGAVRHPDDFFQCWDRL